MSSESSKQPHYPVFHGDYLHSAAVVCDDGQEIIITQEMIDKACDEEQLEIYPTLFKYLS